MTCRVEALLCKTPIGKGGVFLQFAAGSAHYLHCGAFYAGKLLKFLCVNPHVYLMAPRCPDCDTLYCLHVLAKLVCNSASQSTCPSCESSVLFDALH